MGQIEVYEWLKRQRESGQHRFFSIGEIEAGLKENGASCGRNTRSNLLSLRMYGYVETSMTSRLSDWRMLFRIKKKYTATKKRKGRKRPRGR